MHRLFHIAAFLMLFLTGATTALAQNPVKEISDPKAKAILEKSRLKYQSYKTMQADIKLTIQFGADKEIQQGKVYLAGDKYRIELNQQQVISDAKTMWMVSNKSGVCEVQINHADEASLLSPSKLITMYENENEVIIGNLTEATENGKAVYTIEVKPKSSNADYSKVRMSVDKSSNDITQATIFGKDGTRYIFEFIKISGNASCPATLFTYETNPKCKVIDLR